MRYLSITDAKADFSRLVHQAADGEEIVITRAGKPVARMVSFQAPERLPGAWKGRVRISHDFDELPESIMAVFRGEST